MLGTREYNITAIPVAEASLVFPLLPRGETRVDISTHEESLARAGTRKAGGSFYTPPDVVDHLLSLALDPILQRHEGDLERLRALRVLDPACGTGNFLVAVGARIQLALEQAGAPAGEAASVAFGECLVGIDLDPVAAALCVDAIVDAGGNNRIRDAVGSRILCGDALTLVSEPGQLFGDSQWEDLLALTNTTDGFDLVIGNPPFLSQLSAETVRSSAYTERLRHLFGSAVGGLTDTAALFLLLATTLARSPGGVVSLIQPLSVLSAKEASEARIAVVGSSGMEAAWICEEEIFDAAVRVFAPVLIRGEDPPQVRLFGGRSFEEAGAAPAGDLGGPTWSFLLAKAKGVPDPCLETAGTLREIARVTADFRDQYYGLRGCVIDCEVGDDALLPPLVTSGLVDPAQLLWGMRSAKFDKDSYRHPRVDLGNLTGEMAQWSHQRLVPKVLLATQTRVLEAAVDAAGRFLPSVPLLTITSANEESLWKVGALLSSPPITALAARRHLGAALGSDALKLSASAVMDLPLPAHGDCWDQAADCFRIASEASGEDERADLLEQTAVLMCEAFGCETEQLLEWWRARLPTRRGHP